MSNHVQIESLRCGGVRATSPNGADFGYTTYGNTWVLINDLNDDSRLVTNNPCSVIKILHNNLTRFEERRIAYQNRLGDVVELIHDGFGEFQDYAPLEFEPAVTNEVLRRFESLKDDNQS